MASIATKGGSRESAGLPARGDRTRSRPLPVRRRSPQSRKRLLRVILLLLPAAVVYTVFLVYPMVKSLTGSMFAWRGARQGDFAGLDNFVRLFEGRNLEMVNGAFVHNTLWFFSILVVQNVLGLLIAYTLYLRGPRYSFFQAWYFFPAILSPVLVGALWRLLLSPGGPLDTWLLSAGITDEPITLLGQAATALPVVIMVDIWNWIGLPILIFMAGFQAIDPSLFEAARLDGASAGRTLVDIAVPLLIPSVSTLTILTFINSFSQFDLVYIMQGVQGSPNHATDTLVTFFYRLAFGDSSSVGITDVGVALALGTLLFFFLVGLSLIGLRYFNRRAATLEASS
jgi:raffinose/stachyose/melibiose transport system permease protein